MRTISAVQDVQLLNGGHSISLKVEIDRSGAGAWIDLTALQSRNWVREVSITDSVDQPTMTANVSLKRNEYFYSLAPLVASSQLNVGGILVTLYRKIRISVAIMPVGIPASAADYVYIFKGRIHHVEWSGDAIRVEARDHGGDLIDCFIETNAVNYGSAAGVLAQTVMQQILTNQVAFLPAAVTLYSVNGTGGTPFAGGDSPAWLIKPYKQDMMPVFAALDVLAKQIGWLLKYKWNNSVNDFVLTWWDPVRTNTTSLRTFTQSQYRNITECSLHLGEIRNAGRLYYKDVKGNTQSEPSVDAASIALYGRKYIQIAEESTSQINTSTEAAKMIGGAISDLAQPVMDHSVEMPFFWPVEINDIYTFAANGAHYDTNQKLTVCEYTHKLTGANAITTVSLRGKPTAGTTMWFAREVEQERKKLGLENLLSLPSDINNIQPNAMFNQYSRG